MTTSEPGAPATWRRACPLRDLDDDKPLGVVVDEVAVCLVRTGGHVYAVHDECTHASVPLSEGEVDEGTIECWLHGSRFDLATGAVLNLPATEPVATYPVRIVGDDVELALPPA